MDDRLSKFIKVVDAGSYTKASRELRISQPALTMAISKLESELQAELVVKGERPLKMTRAGLLAYEVGTSQLEAIETLKKSLAVITNKKPEVRIGMIDSIAATISAHMDALERLEESAEISLVVNNSRFLQDRIVDRNLDIALVVERSNMQSFQAEHIGREPMVLVCAPQHQQLTQMRMMRHKIDDFISYDQESMTYDYIERGLQEAVIVATTRLRSTYPDFMVHMVLRGKGVAVLPYLMVKDHIAAGRIVAPHLNGKPVVVYRSFCALGAQSKELPEYLKSLISEIKVILLRQESECIKQLYQ